MNIQPGMTYGSDSGWRISDDDTPEAKQFLACVKEVEYYDGSKWVNPYYDYWVEEYKENLYTNLLIKKILDLGVDREILIQRDSSRRLNQKILLLMKTQR